jgi:YidC/Oxa1 family membrane protein insertase
MFTVTDVVKNTGADTATLYPYSLVSRAGEPENSGLYVLHEGPIGVLNDTLEELSYDDLLDDGKSGVISHDTTGGWLDITDKYWLAALVPPQDQPVKARFLHTAKGGVDRFQTDYLGGAVAIAGGGSHEITHRFFGGAKEVSLLDRYEENLSIPLFDKAIDFGWFYYLTKPFFYALEWLYGLLGNFGLAIMALTVGVKIVFFPLANKSYKSMAAMKALQPEMLKLRERHGDDRQKLNQEMMALYKKEKVNPASGCLPIIVQIPVFFSLYKVLIVAIEMRHAPFFGWIKDLSVPDPTNLFNLFGLLPFDPPSFLAIGAWALMMGLTMFLQQKLNPQPTDPMQARIFMLMPVIFTVLLSGFAAGLVIYWTWNNLLSIAQQALIMTRAGVPLGGERKKKKPAAS